MEGWPSRFRGFEGLCQVEPEIRSGSPKFVPLPSPKSKSRILPEAARIETRVDLGGSRRSRENPLFSADDGQVDFGEQGIVGVTISLTGTDDLGQPVNSSQPTDGDGAFVFLNLRPGHYTIAESQPAGYTQGINTVGTGGGTVSNDQFTV